MTKRRATPLNYMVSIYDDPDTPGAFRYTFVPKSVQQARPEDEPPQAVPQYIVSVQGFRHETQFKWIKPPA